MGSFIPNPFMTQPAYLPPLSTGIYKHRKEDIFNMQLKRIKTKTRPDGSG